MKTCRALVWSNSMMPGIPIRKNSRRSTAELTGWKSLERYTKHCARFPYKLFINSLRHPCELFRNMTRWQLKAEAAHKFRGAAKGAYCGARNRTAPDASRPNPSANPAGWRGSFQHSWAASGAERTRKTFDGASLYFCGIRFFISSNLELLKILPQSCNSNIVRHPDLCLFATKSKQTRLVHNG